MNDADRARAAALVEDFIGKFPKRPDAMPPFNRVEFEKWMKARNYQVLDSDAEQWLLEREPEEHELLYAYGLLRLKGAGVRLADRLEFLNSLQGELPKHRAAFAIGFIRVLDRQ